MPRVPYYAEMLVTHEEFVCLKFDDDGIVYQQPIGYSRLGIWLYSWQPNPSWLLFFLLEFRLPKYSTDPSHTK